MYEFIEKQSLPLHLGEPEVPYGKKFDDKSMFRMIYFTDGYDYAEKYSPVPPEKILKSGASSDDYIRAKYHALTVNCELPYFYDPRIEDGARRVAELLPDTFDRKQAVAMMLLCDDPPLQVRLQEQFPDIDMDAIERVTTETHRKNVNILR